MNKEEDKKHQFYIRLMTFIIGPATKTLHLFFEIKVLNSLDFFIFLEKHKHILFHELYPTIPCCECTHVSLAASLKKGRLNSTQFELLFETDNGQEDQDHKRTKGQQTKQLCLCGVSAKRTATVDVMDITLVSAVVKSCCPPGSISGHPSWIKNIKETRNYIAHCPSNKITKAEFDKHFAVTEQAVLKLASVIGPVVLKMVKDQISIFKNSELSTIKDIIKNSNENIRQVSQTEL